MSQAGSSGKGTAVFVTGSTGLLVRLCVASLLTVFVAIASAHGHEDEDKAPDVAALPASGALAGVPTGFDPVILPSLDSIDAQTNITVFLRSGVPDALRLAALRRAWTVDPAIRDFKGLQENGWSFVGANSMSGFGELGPEVDIGQMVARILGDSPRLAALVRSTLPVRGRP